MNGFLLPSVGEEATAHRPIKRERQVTGQCSHDRINEFVKTVGAGEERDRVKPSLSTHAHEHLC